MSGICECDSCRNHYKNEIVKNFGGIPHADVEKNYIKKEMVEDLIAELKLITNSFKNTNNFAKEIEYMVATHQIVILEKLIKEEDIK